MIDLTQLVSICTKIAPVGRSKIVVKSLQKLKTYNPKLSISSNWQIADPLDFAWFGYCDQELQNRYRNNGREPQATSVSLRVQMQLEVRERLGDGKFIAVGIPIDDAVYREVVIIPATFFAADSVKILWDDNSLSGLGRRFVEVRICSVSLTEANDDKPAFDEKKDVMPVEVKKGGGRSNLYFKAKPILTELFRNPAYAAMTACPLLVPFNRAYIALYSTADSKIPGISERSLRTYLKTYRQELAETGNKQSAN